MATNWCVFTSHKERITHKIEPRTTYMKHLLLLLSIISLSWFLPSTANATHIAGGEITYEHLGNDSFLVTLTVYRDCAGIPVTGNESITINSSCTGTQNLLVTLQNVGGTEVSQICPAMIGQSTCNGGFLPGMQKYEYTGIVQLSTHCSDYTFSFSNFARNVAVNVVGGVNSNGFFITATLNSVLYPNNSSPEYTAPPIPYVLVNQAVNYNYGVVENDGDSLTYELVTAREASGNLSYNSGYSATVPIPGITIDAATGQLNFTPTITGNFIIVVRVTEYNGAGQVISTVQRDIQFVVLNYPNKIPNVPTALTNLVNTSGSASFTGPLEVTANVGDQFCFDAVFSDSNLTDVVTVISNATSALPGSTVSYSGTNPVTATICWTVPAGMNTNNTVTFQASDSACPISGVNSVAIQVIIPPPSNLTGALTTTNISCNGVCDGTATVVASGGVGPYQYTWAPTGTWCCQGLASITGMCAGFYGLQVRDLGDPDPSTNTWDTLFVIQDAFPISITITNITDDDCSSTCIGAISTSVFGGQAPLSYLWSSGETTSSIMGKCAGTYTLTVTDANGCTQSQSAIIQEPVPPTVVIDSVDSVTCNGGSDGAIYARAYPTCGVSTDACTTPTSVPIGTGTATNTFSTFPAPYGNSFNGARHQMLFTAAELTAAGVLPGTISSLGLDVASIGTTINYANFTIRMGCTSATDLTGGWETGLTEVFTPKTHTLSTGWNTHNFDVKYFWDGLSNLVVEVCFNSPTSTASGNALTRYTPTTNQSVRYFHDNTLSVCSSTAMTATSTNRPNVRFGNCASSFTYAWSPAPAAGQTTPTASNLTAQTYTITVTSVGDGCTATTTATVNEPTLILPNVTQTGPISCPGQCDASITAAPTGGQGPYTYAWDNGLPATASHSNLCAGTYNVTVTDAKMCSVTGSITVSDPTPIIVSSTVNTVISCNGVCDGNVTINASGGTAPLTITWPGGATGPTQGSLCAGSYDVTITDAGGCSVTHNVNLTQPAVLTTTLVTVGTILCNGDQTVNINSITTGGTVGYNYLWSSGPTTPGLTNVGAGTYTLTVTDDHGCTATDQVTITEPDPLVASITQTAFIQCNGDLTASITASAIGGTLNYGYAWSNGPTTPVNANIGAGTYTVTVTDANGCTDTETIVVTEPTAIAANLTVVTPISCNGVCDGSVTINPSGGTGPYTVQWINGITFVGNTATNLCGGVNYDVTITDANNCQHVEPFTLTEPALLTASINLDQGISCGGVCDAQITAVPTGGTGPFTYVWNNGLPANASHSNLCAGTYNVTITDANLCTATSSITITEPPVLVGAVAQAGTILCNGDQTVTLTASATGGTPVYGYAWSNGPVTAINANVGAGTYTVTITDANGCTDVVTEIVSGPTLLTATNTVNNHASCNGVCDGSATVTAAGGTPNYSYAWPGGLTGPTQNALCGGTYIVTITDDNGCDTTTTVVINEPQAINLSSSNISHVSCNGVCDGSATVTATGGTNPITITWPGGATGGTQNNLCAGTYVVTATDANSCSNTISITITEPNALSISLAQVGTILCNGDSTVTINSTVTGGTPTFSYLWSTGSTNANLVNTGAGTYTVTVTDDNGCTATASTVVTEPTVLDVTITQTGFISCGGLPTASLLATGSGGTNPYSFSWSNGAGTAAISSLPAGPYTVTITDGNGCTDTASFIITQPTPIVANQTIVNGVSCNGVCDGSVTYAPTGGTPGYTITWPAGVTVSNDTATALCGNTNYIVTITDANSCTITDTINLVEPTAVSGTINLDQGISCGGICDAQITATGSGGTGPYTYAWSNGLSGATINNLCAGSYTVTITDANLCTGTASITITQPSPVVTTITQTGTILCFGDSTVTLTASTTGGTGPYTYLWNTGATGPVITNTGAGTYSLTTTDANSCSVVTPFVVTEPADIVLTANITSQISCNGACDGAATVIAVGGTPGMTFTWPGGATGPSQSGLCAGSYVVTVTDANACSETITVNLVDPQGIVIITNVTSHVSCNGVCDGEATITLSGGTSPLTIAWPSGGNGTTESGLCAGTHTVTVTDANSCSSTATIVINDASLMTVSLVETSGITCNSACDGVVSATVSGGTAPYLVVWPGSDTTDVKTGLCAGSYTVTVVDANGCSTTQSVTLTEPNALAVNVSISNAITCNGVCDGELTANVTGGTAPYTVTWSNGTNGTVAGSLCAGSYTVTVVDANGCTTTGSMTITEPSAITATPQAIDALCGACDGVIIITGTSGGDGGPYTYNWSGGTPTPLPNSIINLCAGVYTVTITDGSGCTAVITQGISNIGGPTSANFNRTNPTCNGGSNGSLTVTPSGGSGSYSYSWSSGGSNATETGLSAGVHFVTITDGNGCILIASDTLFEPDPIVNTPVIVDASCNSTCDGSITLTTTGGTGPYTYAWNNSMTGSVITGLCDGAYIVTTTDANSCTKLDTFNVGEPVALSASIAITNPISCNGTCDGEMTATVTGGTAPYSISWSNGGIGNIAVGLCGGTYTLTVTDANGCSTTASSAINFPPPISTNIATTDATCGACDGQIALTGTIGGNGGPYTYAWSNGASTSTISNLCPGVYTVTMTDVSGCNALVAIPVGNIGGPTSAPISLVNPTCNGVCDGSMTVAPVGGTGPYSYAWSSGGTTDSESGLCAGIYFVTVTDANGCVFIGTDTLVEPTPIIINEVISHVTCNGLCDGSITLTTSGGTGPYSFVWSNGSSTGGLSNLCAGSYTVTVTDANGCSSVRTYTVTEPALLTVSLGITSPISCNGSCDGMITATISGGTSPFTYAWSNSGSGNSINSLCDGAYSVTVTDGNGCTATASQTISEPAAITATLTPTNATCGVCDGQITITNTAGGDGGPYSYAWSNSGTGTTINNLCPGTYSVTITDGSGCTAVLSAPISNNGGPTGATFVNRDPSCSGLCDGMTRVTPIGGAGPYTYAWSNGSVVDSAYALCAGVHTVTITDANGCIFIASDTLSDPAPIVNVETIVDASCNGVCDGSITLVTSGGTGPYNYAWSNSGNTNSISALCAGSYTVTVTDDNGCTVVNTYNVTEPTPIQVSIVGLDANCSNVCDGTATATATGGTGPYTYAWSNSDVGPIASNLCGGTTYDVTVTDANGCTTTGSVTISSPPALVIDNIIVTNPGCGASDGSLETVISGGTPGYTISWNGTPGNPIVNIPSGSYLLSVTDANGCVVTSTVPLSDAGTLGMTLSTTDVPCDGSCVGTATATPTGGTGPFSYQWSNGDLTQTATNLCAGQVIVTVTDAVGGCMAVDTVTVNQIPGLNISMAFTDNTNCNSVCDGTATATVSGSTGTVTYAWSNGGPNSPTLTGLCAGTYTVTATDAAGCSAIDSVIISDGVPLALTVDTVIKANCLNTNDGGVQITATGGIPTYSYNWTGPNGFTSGNQNIGFLFVGTYYVTVTDQNGCTVTDSAVVTANTNLTVSLADQIICDGSDSVLLNPVVSGANGAITYQWYNLGGAVIGNDSTLMVPVTGDTIYYIVGVVSGGCSALDTAAVAKGQIPDVDAGVGQTIIRGQDVKLGGNPTTSWGGSTFLWSPGASLSDPTVANPIATPTVTTLYTVTVTNIVGCTNSDTITITVNKKLKVISGFTPNGDGSNDTWELDFLDKYPQAQVDVYNRWGELLFHSEDGYTTPWDGTFEGEPVPVGTYYYVIDLKDGDFPEPISGPVTIMR
ncbi:gliding motility-associated C-terminal domain-containing protein [bacterium SCSIO 12643]|nr:gliding motility-associated C-terminal domain-containing protein [bacterium SCSIO 12643]